MSKSRASRLNAEVLTKELRRKPSSHQSSESLFKEGRSMAGDAIESNEHDRSSLPRFTQRRRQELFSELLATEWPVLAVPRTRVRAKLGCYRDSLVGHGFFTGGQSCR